MAATRHLGGLRSGHSAAAILAASGVHMLSHSRRTLVLYFRCNWRSHFMVAALVDMALEAMARPDDLVRAVTRAVRPANLAARVVARARGCVVAPAGRRPHAAPVDGVQVFH